MLALASALADGELAPLLDRVTVVIVPRANPDGAAAAAGAPAPTSTSTATTCWPPCPRRARCSRSWPSCRPTWSSTRTSTPPPARGWRPSARWPPGTPCSWRPRTRPCRAAVTGLAETRVPPGHGGEAGRATASARTPTSASPGGEAEDRRGAHRRHRARHLAQLLRPHRRRVAAGRDPRRRRRPRRPAAARRHPLSRGRRRAGDGRREAPRLRRTVDEARRGLAADLAALAVDYAVPTTPAVLVLHRLRDRRAARRCRSSCATRGACASPRTGPRPPGTLSTAEAAEAMAALRIKGVRSCAAALRPLQVEAYRLPTADRRRPAAREGINARGTRSPPKLQPRDAHAAAGRRLHAHGPAAGGGGRRRARAGRARQLCRPWAWRRCRRRASRRSSACRPASRRAAPELRERLERAAGIEPARAAWEAARLPLHHARGAGRNHSRPAARPRLHVSGARPRCRAGPAWPARCRARPGGRRRRRRS